MTIDFKNKLLSIESKKSLNELLANKDFTIPLQINNDRNIEIGISTTIKLSDTLTLDVGLDSGSGDNSFIFSVRYMNKLGIDKEKVESKFRPSMFDPEKGNIYYYKNLSKMTDKHNNVSVLDFRATFVDGLIHEGITSINWIGNKITIDIPNQRLIVQR